MQTDIIYCGECSQVMREHIPDNSIDLTVTSPPYDNLRKYNGYVFPFEEIAKELYRVTKIGGVVVWVVADATIKGSETGTSFRQALYFKEIGFNLHDTMIYQRNTDPPKPKSLRYKQSFEYMFVFTKGGISWFNGLTRETKLAGKIRKRGKGSRQRNGEFKLYQETEDKPINRTTLLDNVWHVYGNSFKHPACFPEKLAEDHILSWSNPEDIVFDPMCGSGTTLKMAKKNNRKYIGIDISQEYVELSQQRVLLAGEKE